MAGRADIQAGRAFVSLYMKRGDFDTGLANARKKLQDFATAANMIGRPMMAAASAALIPLGLAGNQFIKFDDQMRTVATVAQSTQAELAQLTAVAKQLGATTSFTAVEVAELMTELGRAGFSANQIEAMTAAVLDLSRASGTNAAASAGIMAATIRQFGLEASEATRVADALTVAANASFSSVTGLGESLSYAGPVAADFNMSIEQTLAILGALGNVGIQGSEAGTALRRLLTITGAQARELRTIFGVAFTDAAGNARPLVDVLEEVNQVTKNLGSSQRAAKFNEAFGILGITAASALGKTSVSVRDLYAQLQNASGTAAKSAADMDAGPGGAFRRFRSAVEGSALAIAEDLVPLFMSATKHGTALANTVTKIAQNSQGFITGSFKAILGVGATGAGLIALSLGANAAAMGLRVLSLAMKPASAVSSALLATLRAGGVFSTQFVRGMQGVAGVVGRSLVQSTISASNGLAATAIAGRSMAVSLAQSAYAAGSAITQNLIGALFRLPAAMQTIAVASRAVFAGVSSAASGFSRELQYWLSRPFEYFRAITPLFALDLQTGWANALTRIRAMGTVAAEGLRVAWSTATTAISGMMGQASSFISSRFAAIAGPVANQFQQAWSVATGAVSARVAVMWNAISSPANSVMNRIRGSFGPLLQQDFSRIVGYARSAAQGVVAAFRYAGPAIASGLVTAASGAFTRIRAMGAATARSLASGMGAGIRGISGLLMGGAGLLGMAGAGAGGALGQLAMVAPQLMLIGSSMTMLINPATVMIAAIAGGVYLWTQYSKEGKAALSAVQDAMAPMVTTAKTTFEGISDAIKGGDLATAGKIAFAGLKLASIEGMMAINDAVMGNWKQTTQAVGDEIGGDGMVTPWENATRSMAAIWDQWSNWITQRYIATARGFVDAWKNAVTEISGWMLSKSAEGGLMGQLISKFIGVDMNTEQARAELQRQEEIRVKERGAQRLFDDADRFEQAGDHESAAAARKVAEEFLASVGALKQLPADALGYAKAFAGEDVSNTFKSLDQFIRELEQQEQARADNSKAALPDWEKIRTAAAEELGRLRNDAAENLRRKQLDDFDKALGERLGGDPNAVANGGKGAAGVRGMLESRSFGGTFSAAAAIAMGRAGGGPDAVARAQLEEQKTAAKVLRDMKGLLDQNEALLKKIATKVDKQAGKAAR